MDYFILKNFPSFHFVTHMGSATGKSWGGGKGSSTERQIGMLPVATLLCINKVKCH